MHTVREIQPFLMVATLAAFSSTAWTTEISQPKPLELDPTIGSRGPNCHRPDTDGIIRFAVMDAGSTGTRAVLHRFRVIEPNDHLVAAAAAAAPYDSGTAGNGSDSTGGNEDAAASLQMGNASLQLLKMVRFSQKPGLSSYARFPERSRESLKALLEKLSNEVPLSVRPITCLVLRSTAGLRLLDSHSRTRLLQVARSTLGATAFRAPGASHMSSDMAGELTGSQEAQYSWMAVNLLLGSLATIGSMKGRGFRSEKSGDVETKPLLEIGGGSLQVAYEISSPKEQGSKQKEDVASYKRTLQTKSYLGLGVKESVLRFVNYGHENDPFEGEDNRTKSQPYKSQCLAANLTLSFSFGPVSNLPLVGLGGGGGKCLTRAQEVVKETKEAIEEPLPNQPDLTVYAISAAYYLLKYLSKSSIANVSRSRTVCPAASFPCDAYTTTVGKIAEATATVCADPPKKGTFEVYYCINLATLDALLRFNLRLSNETMITALGKQKSLGWPLGLSLEYLQVSLTHYSDPLPMVIPKAAALGPSASSTISWLAAAIVLQLVLL